MDKKELILVALSPAKGELHTPVQVQKLLFVIEANISESLGGKHFRFKPYHYGPFDKDVYEELKKLASEGYVEINNTHGWNSYKLTRKGQKKGDKLFKTCDKEIRKYIKEVSQFVRALSFTELVVAIYKAYPEMRKNSVFVSS